MWIKPTLYIVWSRNTKINKPASAALKQIDDQGYMIPYSADGRKLYKIGVSFNTKTRTVEDWDYNIGQVSNEKPTLYVIFRYISSFSPYKSNKYDIKYSEAIISNIQLLECIQQAIWIEHSLHQIRKKITIILLLEHSYHPIFGTTIMFRHLIYRFCKILQHLIYRNTTQSLIFRRHTDVAWLIKVTEHTDLGELGDTCEQYKLQMLVRYLEGREESTEQITIILLVRDFASLMIDGILQVLKSVILGFRTTLYSSSHSER